MVRFEDALDVRPLDDGVNWQVLDNFFYDTDVELTPNPGRTGLLKLPTVNRPGGVGGWRVRVPRGFVTDFGSVHRLFWTLVGAPAEGKQRRATVVHDGLYRTKGLATKSQADRVFLEAMKASGVSRRVRWTYYLAVKFFGGSSYKGGL